MKVSVSPRRMSRRVARSLGILFILALVVLAYAATSLTAYAAPKPNGMPGHAVTYSWECPPGDRLKFDDNPGVPPTCLKKNGQADGTAKRVS
jgi:hypothetical protein